MDVGRYGNIELPIEKSLCFIWSRNNLHFPVNIKLSFCVAVVSCQKTKGYKSNQKYF